MHSASKVTMSLQLIIRISLICIAFVTIADLQNFRLWASAEKKYVCKTKECYSLADYIKKNLNEKVNPCSDFYQYVCHGFPKEYPRPPHKELWDLESSMERRVLHEMKKYLEDPKVSKTKNAEDAKVLYKACMSLPSMTKHDASKIKSIMATIGKWPMFFQKTTRLPTTFPWAAIDNLYQSITGESAMFETIIKFDEETKKLKFQFQQPRSAYGALYRFDDWEGEKKYYEEFLMKVIISVAPTDPKPFMVQIQRDLEDVLEFRDDLEEILRSEPDQNIERMTIKEWDEAYDKVAHHPTSKIKWVDKIHAIIKNSNILKGIKPDEMLYLPQPDYFQSLIELIAITPRRVLINHIHLYFAERHLELNSDMKELLEKAVIASSDPTGEIFHLQPKWEWCIQSNNIKDGLTLKYIKNFFPGTDKAGVEHLLEKAKDLLKEQISESNWLESMTISRSIKKIDAMKTVIGYPKYLMKSKKPSDDDGLELDPLAADAYYEEGKNRLSVSAAYLQLPIYRPNLPFAVDYGSTVSMLGHELYHAFDQKGVKLNENGTRPFWPEKKYKTFKEQVQCFRNQYEAYRRKESQKMGLPNNDIYPDTTDEDMADVMGLKLAYLGYKKKLEKKKNECPVLPGLEHINCDKLFFIAFGNGFCADLSPTYQKMVLSISIHSLYHIRLNGAVKNMNAFSYAFGCTPNDPLYAKNTCDIWKRLVH